MGTFIVTSLLGLGVFLLGYFRFRKARASQSWPSTPGTIVGGTVRKDETRDEDGREVSYVPVVEYQFAVGGASFRGHRVRFDDRGYGSQRAAQKALAGFPAGTPVTVYYNPREPSDCVLERKQSAGWVFMAVGVLLLVAAIVQALK